MTLASHKLQVWLAERALSQRAFAAQVGLYQPTVNRYLRGVRMPCLVHAAIIERATGGAVMAADFTKPLTD